MIHCPVCFFDTETDKMESLTGEVIYYETKCTNPNCGFKFVVEQPRGKPRSKPKRVYGAYWSIFILIAAIIITTANLSLNDLMKLPYNQNYSLAGKNWTEIGGVSIPCCPSPWYPADSPQFKDIK
jgi:hypothetical protein